MASQKEIDFYKFVKTAQKNLSAKQEHYNKSRKLFRVLFYVISIVSVIAIIFTIDTYIKFRNDNFLFGIALISTLSIIILGLRVYPYTSKIPEDHKKIDKYFWNQEKKYIILTNLGFLILILLASVFQINKGAQFFLIFAIILLLFYLIILIYIRKNLSFLKSSFLTGLGTGFHYFSIFSLIMFSGFKWRDFYINFITIICVGIGIIMIFYLEFKKKQINSVQSIILRTVDPQILLLELKPNWRKIKDKEKALKIYKEISKEGRYGIRKELAKLITQQESSPRSFLTGMLIAFLLFFIGSIGEGLIQDFFNEPIKKILCDFFNIFCI